MLFVIFFLTSCLNQKDKRSKAAVIKTIQGREIKMSDLEHFIKFEMDSLKIPALSIAIINDRNVVYSKNIGVKNILTQEPVDENTLFEACSLSKPVFAYFVTLLANKGIIDLDTPLYTYYKDPEIADDTNYKLLTARTVLCQASGFPNWRENSGEKLHFLFTPGTQYGYSGEGYQCLARVIAHIINKTDKELNAIFQKEVVVPLKIHSMNFTWQNSMSTDKAFSHREGKPTDNGSQGSAEWFGAAGSLHTDATDYAKFLVAIMKDKSKLPLALQETMPAEKGLRRSLLFPYIKINNKIKYYHSGNNGDTRAYSQFYLDSGNGIVLFGNCDHFFSSQFAAKILKYLDEELTL